MEMFPKKLETIRLWPTPRKKQELQQYLGDANFYRRFIKDFSKIASPLHLMPLGAGKNLKTRRSRT